MSMGTIVVLLIVVAGVALAIRSLVRRGKNGCACGCEGCSGAPSGKDCARGNGVN